MKFRDKILTLSSLFVVILFVYKMLESRYGIHEKVNVNVDFKADLEHGIRVEEFNETVDFNKTLFEVKDRNQAAFAIVDSTWHKTVATFQKSSNLMNYLGFENSFTPGLPKIRCIIVTTWRSGSTFLGELFNSLPVSFYSTEPLLFSGLARIYNNSNDSSSANNALYTLKSLMRCNFKNVFKKYKELGLPYSLVNGGSLLWNNKLLKKICSGSSPHRLSTCKIEAFFESICLLSPIQIIKTVRLSLDLVHFLLQDPELANLKVIYLTRDPRALIHSRNQRDFCSHVPSCIDPSAICSDSAMDFHASQKLIKTFPDKLMILKYEDFAKDVTNKSAELLSFLGIGLLPEVLDFINVHTSASKFEEDPKPWNTFRDPHYAANRWKEEMDFSDILSIQDQCHESMKLWGYKSVRTEDEITIDL